MQQAEIRDTSLLPLAAVLEAVSGSVIADNDSTADFFFYSVATDSRQAAFGTLFIPLLGTERDGHSFIPEALERGASAVLCAASYADAHSETCAAYHRQYPACVFIRVENTLRALQRLAARYIAEFPQLKRVGITGSSGKTTTKEFCAAVLSQRYSVITNEGNLNSETGLPLSVFRIRAEHEVGIFEMGMNRAGEIQELTDVLLPDYAVITNIGTAHIGILGSKQAIAAEKRAVFSHFDGSQTALIPDADEYTDFLRSGVNGTVVYFGPNGSLPATDIRDNGLTGSSFCYDGLEIQVPLPGCYNVYNALAAAALGNCFGLTAAEIKAGIEHVSSLLGRSEILRGTCTVIQDCYNANPDSMQKALELFASLETEHKKIAVLGDMLELGEYAQEYHQHIAAQAINSQLDAVVFIGEAMARAAENCMRSGGTAVYVFKEGLADSSAAGALLQRLVHAGDIVLFKGSRGMALERLVPYVGINGRSDV